MGPPKGDSVIRPHPPANRSPAQAGGASAPYGRLTLMPPGATVQPSAALRPIYRVFYTSAGHVHCRGGRAMDAKKVGASDTKLAPTWRSRRDSNPRAVLAATRFPVVLVMTTSILLHILFQPPPQAAWLKRSCVTAIYIITDILHSSSTFSKFLFIFFDLLSTSGKRFHTGPIV